VREGGEVGCFEAAAVQCGAAQGRGGTALDCARVRLGEREWVCERKRERQRERERVRERQGASERESSSQPTGRDPLSPDDFSGTPLAMGP